MFNRLFHFLKGYVIIEVYGSDTERFLNICVRRNIDIHDAMRRENGALVLRIPKNDFFKIRQIVYKTHSRVRILKKAGIYDLKRKYGTRYTFFAGIIIMIFFLAISSGYIWTVEINGVYDSDYDKIVEILKSDGVYVGAKKKNIKEKRIIKQSLVNGTDDIAWAWIYIEGAKARIEVYEKTLPSIPIETSDPCNIVAASDGYIEQITTIKGHSLVKNGTTVSRGDVLISGKVPIFKEYEEERYFYVHPSGTVRAMTYHEKSGIYSLNRESRLPTGRQKNYYSIELFGKLFRLFKSDEPSFENYDAAFKRHELKIPYFGYSGICLNIKTCKEVKTAIEPIMYDTAVEIAKNDLEEKIAKELLKNPELVNSETECETINDESIKVTLKMTLIEDIGVTQPFEAENTNSEE